MSIHLFSIIPEGFKELTLPEGLTFLQYNCLRWNGDSKLLTWSEAELVWLQDELSQDTDEDADFIKFSGVTVVSEHVYALLKNTLNSSVEFLPVIVDGGRRYILNVINVLDLMRKEKSIYKIYSDGKVGMCEHAFLTEPAAENLIYRVSGYFGRIFVNDEFKNMTYNNRLTGALIRKYINPGM